MQCKINVQGRNSVQKKNCTVPNKNRTEGEFARKK